ncbi:polysaccharide deacetylase [Paenibacillus sp. SC116]|uniref:polysaccharide deacetylase family protein n=1 Tax=Paenibacillus sp. SC116 TaxID=2968986 RepID=UPI00215AEE41|nr:polysaccharide deacetylase family protein [Paenibacillus sp. SC116]MCR8842529.1 polysaccharide deacetylase [Paenibacillus sp. SC116]
MSKVKIINKKKRFITFALGVVLLTIFLASLELVEFAGKDTAGNAQAYTIQSVKQNSELVDGANEEKKKQEQTSSKKTAGKTVYLTFDDGPSTLTGQFLDVLKEHDVKATFFMQGNNLNNTTFQENVKRTVQEGHYLGAHSMTHDHHKIYTNKQFVPEMKETINLIRDITGVNSTLVRPPYGSAPGLKSKQIRDEIVDAEMKIWDWTIDSEDWKLRDNPDKIVENIKEGTLRDVEVVLMHEKTQTLQALPAIINFYKERGYEFVAYDEDHHFSLNFQKDERL